MALDSGAISLAEIAASLVRILEALRGATPFEFLEADFEVPFVGKPTQRSATLSIAHFPDVSVIAKHVGSAAASDIWRLNISIAEGRPAVMKVESYGAPTTA